MPKRSLWSTGSHRSFWPLLVSGTILPAFLFAIDRWLAAAPDFKWAGIGFLLTAANFAHGKFMSLSDEDPFAGRPFASSMYFFLSLLVSVSFYVQARGLQDARLLVFAVLATRVLDIAADSVLLFWSRLEESNPDILRANRIWVMIDLGVLATFGVIAFQAAPVVQHAYWVGIIYSATAALDVILDYSLNVVMYFSRTQSWGNFAKEWDARQGKDGDIYRRAIIVPALEHLVKPEDHPRVLDLGCGNGCIARRLAEAGARVYAVDKFPTMIELAKKHTISSGELEYEVVDIEARPKRLGPGNFDFVIAVFTMQDCTTLLNPFGFMMLNLAPGGTGLVIEENDYAFSQAARHFTTRRRWVDRKAQPWGGRRQVIEWLQKGTEDSYLATETRHWGTHQFVLEAREHSLIYDSSGDLELPLGVTDDSPELLAYRANPKFEYILFRRHPVRI